MTIIETRLYTSAYPNNWGGVSHILRYKPVKTDHWEKRESLQVMEKSITARILATVNLSLFTTAQPLAYAGKDSIWYSSRVRYGWRISNATLLKTTIYPDRIELSTVGGTFCLPSKNTNRIQSLNNNPIPPTYLITNHDHLRSIFEDLHLSMIYAIRKASVAHKERKL